MGCLEGVSTQMCFMMPSAVRPVRVSIIMMKKSPIALLITTSDNVKIQVTHSKLTT